MTVFSDYTGSQLTTRGGTYDSGVTAGDLTAKIGFGVKLDTDKTVVVAGDGDPIVGVLVSTEGTAAGSRCRYQVTGGIRGYAGATFNEGVNLACNASGHFVLATTGETIVAKAMQSSTGAGAYVDIELSVASGAVAA